MIRRLVGRTLVAAGGLALLVGAGLVTVAVLLDSEALKV